MDHMLLAVLGIILLGLAGMIVYFIYSIFSG
jgi:preprotein translocase subunit Sss1